MEFTDPKLLGNAESYERLAAQHRLIADALEAVARAIRGQNVMVTSKDRAIHRILELLKERGPMSEEAIIEAIKDGVTGRENPAREVKKSIGAGLRHGKLVLKDGMISLP